MNNNYNGGNGDDGIDNYGEDKSRIDDNDTEIKW